MRWEINMIVEKKFLDPPARDRIKPFWFWNSRLEKEELVEQIIDMHQHGVGGFFIHARFGLETEYLSQEWFDAIRLCVSKAKDYGMEVWLYDENPFPSGIGELKVSKHRAFRNRYVECEEYLLKPGDEIVPVESGEVISVQCFEGFNIIPLPFTPSSGRIYLKEPLQEETRVIIFIERILESPNDKIFGIDYMNEDAVRYFIETTHEKYLENLGEHFGKTIKGIFTDEPTLLPWHQDINWYIARGNGRVVAWNPKIYEILNQRYGYGIDELMAAIFYSGDASMENVRRKFWSVVAQLYETSFFKIYSEWCHKHGLILTGHVLLEEGLYFNTIFQGNIIKNLEYFDIPGVDHLTKAAEKEGLEFLVGDASHIPRVKTNVQGQKVISSLAHLSGKSKVISESFGVGGWGLNLEDMKWITNWQYALGINQLCPHAFFYSIEGFRKCDAPPCHMHNSSWRNYKIFADYVARLSYVLCQGIHKADIAVLYPLSSFQSVYVAGLQQQNDKDISDVYDMLCALLPKIHYDYDIIGEHHLLGARLHHGRLLICDEQFKVLLVPSTKGLTSEHMKKIEEFVSLGGMVFLFNQTNTDGNVLSVHKEEHGGIWCRVSRLDLDDMGQIEYLRGLLKDFITANIKRDVNIVGTGHQEVYYIHKSLENEEIFFFANTSRGHGADVEISLAATGYPVIYHTETGRIEPLNNYSVKNNGISFYYEFPPCGSLLMGIRKGKPVFDARSIMPIIHTEGLKERRITREEWRFSLEGYNVLPLNDWKFSIRIDSGGTQYRYRTDFEIMGKMEVLKLMLDDMEYRKAFMGQMDLRLFVNGKKAVVQDGYYIEKKFKTFPIIQYIKKGSNTIDIIINHSAWSDEPHLLTSPAKILGDFQLKQQGRVVLDSMEQIVRLDSWTAQGYPFYSGTASYTKEFRMEAIPRYAKLYFEEVADCVEVYINGQHAGTRVWRPWEINITPFLTKGNNNITLKVTNTLINFIENTPKPSGILGDAVIYYE